MKELCATGITFIVASHDNSLESAASKVLKL